MMAATVLTRFISFIIFSDREIPDIIAYLGKVLPAAMMGLLVVYSYKDYTPAEPGTLAAALAAGLVTALVHIKKRSTALSISIGTLLFMLLSRIL